MGVSRGRLLGGLGLSVLSAVFLIVIWEAFGNLWWLTFVAFVPMYVAQYRVLPRRWSAVPVGTAFAAYYLALAALGSSVLPVWTILATAAVFGFVGLGIGIVLRPFAERTNYRWFVVQFGLIWVAIDLLVQDNETIGTYSWIAYRIGGHPEFVQPVSVLSTPALNLLLHVVNAAIALAVLALIDRRWPQLADVPIPRRVLTWSLGVPAVVCAAWVACSLAIYTSVTDRMGPEVRVAAVQPGLDNATPGTLISAGDLHPGRTEEQRRTAQIAELSDMTRQAAARGANIVVWPEETLDYDPRVTDTDWVPALVRRTGVYLAMGFTPDAKNGSAPNAALLWAPDGTVTAVYYKTKRVLAEGESFMPGTVYPTVETAHGTVGMIICFDIDFPDGPARRVAANGAQMILAPSIDFESVADVRSASTAFRAIENRVAMVKADVAWDSVIIAPNGRVVTSTAVHAERGDSALLVADIPMGPRGAPFTRFSGAPFRWLEWIVTIVMLGVLVRKKIREPEGSLTPGE